MREKKRKRKEQEDDFDDFLSSESVPKAIPAVVKRKRRKRIVFQNKRKEGKERETKEELVLG